MTWQLLALVCLGFSTGFFAWEAFSWWRIAMQWEATAMRAIDIAREALNPDGTKAS